MSLPRPEERGMREPHLVHRNCLSETRNVFPSSSGQSPATDPKTKLLSSCEMPGVSITPWHVANAMRGGLLEWAFEVS